MDDGPGWPTPLVGRDDELARLVGAVSRLWSSGSGLVIIGAAGSGKTALLEDFRRRSGGVRVLNGSRPQAAAAPYAVLRETLGPGAPRLSGTTDAFTASLALLDHLVASARETGGLVLVFDDADQLDRPSLEALLFAARRIENEPIAIVLAAREGRGHDLGTVGLETLRLGGLDRDASRALLRESARRPVARDAAAVILAVARGNPRALLEIPAALSDEELAGMRALPDPLPPGDGARADWGDRIVRLEPEGRAQLLLAAADGSGRLDVLAAGGNLSPTDLTVAEQMGLITIDGDAIEFAHPLIRSCVYHLAAPAARRQAHQTLADRYEGTPDVDRWAHHLAAATIEPDEEVAAALEAGAAVAARRDGPTAVTSMMERAAELSPESPARGKRLVAAARASSEAGLGRTESLLARAGPLITDSETRAEAALVAAAVALGAGRPGDAFEVLIAGAEAAVERDPTLAVDLTARSSGIAWWSGRRDWSDRSAGLARRTTADGSPYADFVGRAATVGSEVLAGRLDGIGALLPCLHAAHPPFTRPRELLFASEVAGLCGDEIGLRLQATALRLLRQEGDRSALPFALELFAFVNVWQGRLRTAREAAREGLEVAEALGEEQRGPFQMTLLAHLAALAGDADRCREHAERVIANSPDGRAESAMWALGRLELSLDRPAAAVEQLAAITGPLSPHRLVALFAAPDLIEACAECDRHDLALPALAQFERWSAAGSPWAGAVVPRLRGALAEGEEAERDLRAALAVEGSEERQFDLGRANLLLGRLLRRGRRRLEAREPLRLAIAAFEGLGLEAWSQRAQSELRASGEAATPDRVDLDALTAQELEIARMVSRGGSNREVAASLTLSPRTIEYHLSKIYVKLGISSRGELANVLPVETDRPLR